MFICNKVTLRNTLGDEWIDGQWPGSVNDLCVAFRNWYLTFDGSPMNARMATQEEAPMAAAAAGEPAANGPRIIPVSLHCSEVFQ